MDWSFAAGWTWSLQGNNLQKRNETIAIECTLSAHSIVFYIKNFDYPEKTLKYKHIRRISD